MILLCEHPVATGCESAQSTSRSSFHRPGAPAGCSRCERLPDTPASCAASSKVVPGGCPTFAPSRERKNHRPKRQSPKSKGNGERGFVPFFGTKLVVKNDV